MDAPLNVLIYADYRGRLADEAKEFGLTDLTAEFIRTRQVYHLDVRATAPNGDLMSASFETGKATVHNLTKGTTTEKIIRIFFPTGRIPSVLSKTVYCLSLRAVRRTRHRYDLTNSRSKWYNNKRFFKEMLNGYLEC